MQTLAQASDVCLDDIALARFKNIQASAKHYKRDNKHPKAPQLLAYCTGVHTGLSGMALTRFIIAALEEDLEPGDDKWRMDHITRTNILVALEGERTILREEQRIEARDKYRATLQDMSNDYDRDGFMRREGMTFQAIILGRTAPSAAQTRTAITFLAKQLHRVKAGTDPFKGIKINQLRAAILAEINTLKHQQNMEAAA